MKRITVKAEIILSFADLEEDASEEEIGKRTLETEIRLNELGDHSLGETIARFHLKEKV